MEEIKKIYYVYYSFEESGRGYIGYRKCPEGLTPETDKYLGSATDKTFKPIGKTILKGNLTLREAIAVEIYFQRKYLVAEDWNKEYANLSYQTSEGFYYSATGEDNPNYGKKWYNNGIENKLFSPDKEIPEGYFLGMLGETKQKQSEAKRGNSIYNNGIIERRFYQDGKIPEGYILGRLPYSKETIEKQSIVQSGKKLINNGIEQRKINFNDEIPLGFSLGMLEERKEKYSGEKSPSYGKSWYYNGIEENLYFPDQIPSGYIKGRKPVSSEFKQNMSESLSGEKHPNYGKVRTDTTKYKCKVANGIKVLTPKSCFYSVSDACKELNISKSKFYKLYIKSCNKQFYYNKSEYTSDAELFDISF
jgi:hypothetical protein